MTPFSANESARISIITWVIILICDIVADSKCLTVANIYAPNEDDPNFFHSFFDHLSSFRGEEIIIGGDFNLVLDVKKDKRGGLARTHQKALKVIQDFSEKSWFEWYLETFQPRGQEIYLAPKPTCRTLPTWFFSGKWIILMWCNPCRYCSWLQNGPFYDYSECSSSLEPQRQRFLEVEHVPLIPNEICPRN